MSQSDFVANTSQFCNISIKTSYLLMNFCYGLNVDLWEVWGFVGLKKPEGCFILSRIPFIACSIFLKCLCSEFVVSGEEDWCKNEDCSCVPDDIEGLPFKNMYVLLSSTLLMLSLKSSPILCEISSLFRWEYLGALKTVESTEEYVSSF